MIILLRVASANFSHLNFSASAGLLTVESSSLSLLIISCSCIKIDYSILKCVRFNAKPFKIRTCLLIEHGFHEFPIPKIQNESLLNINENLDYGDWKFVKPLSRSAHQTPNFTNSELQFPQFKVLQSVFFFLI